MPSLLEGNASGHHGRGTRRRTPMSKPPLPAEAAELLAKPNPAVIATLRPDGQPVSAATWYLWE
ncbi:MAG: pyridoxamine 5'-phosphate oxidase family protein, partial [Nocardioidaceae bacterium]